MLDRLIKILDGLSWLLFVSWLAVPFYLFGYLMGVALNYLQSGFDEGYDK